MNLLHVFLVDIKEEHRFCSTWGWLWWAEQMPLQVYKRMLFSPKTLRNDQYVCVLFVLLKNKWSVNVCVSLSTRKWSISLGFITLFRKSVRPVQLSFLCRPTNCTCIFKYLIKQIKMFPAFNCFICSCCSCCSYLYNSKNFTFRLDFISFSLSFLFSFFRIWKLLPLSSCL